MDGGSDGPLKFAAHGSGNGVSVADRGAGVSSVGIGRVDSVNWVFFGTVSVSVQFESSCTAGMLLKSRDDDEKGALWTRVSDRPRQSGLTTRRRTACIAATDQPRFSGVPGPVLEHVSQSQLTADSNVSITMEKSRPSGDTRVT